MKVIYFPIRGKAEAIRLMLLDNGVEYEEINCGPTWQTEYKAKMPFGQVPCLVDEEKNMVQSVAILRYLARKFNQYGDTDYQAYQADMFCDGVEDLRTEYVLMIYRTYEAGKGPFIESLPGKLEKFENLLTDGPFILGSKVCFADYDFFDLLDILQVLSPGCIDSFDKLKKYYNGMASRPAIKKRRDTDEFKKLNINGNGKQ